MMKLQRQETVTILREEANMSGISGVSGYSNTGSYYSALSSGSRINSAKDGAAELSIINKEDSQVRGYNAGSENLEAAKSVTNIADGALSGVADYLQRIKELAVKAGNGLITNDDKKAIQSEIDQLKEGISNSASTTEYNGIKLLDGSRSSMQIISDGNGTSHELENVNSTLDALGIKDFSVMGNYDIGDIDKALEKVSNGRTQIGAQANGLESAFNYNSIASYNTTASKSRLSDTEYGEYVSKLQKETNLNTYKLMMQKKQQQNEASNIARIMTSI